MSLHIRAASQKPKACSIFEQLEQARGLGKQLLFPFICNTHRPRNHWEIMRLLIQLRALCEVRQYLYLVEGRRSMFGHLFLRSLTPGFLHKRIAGALTVKDIRC